MSRTHFDLDLWIKPMWSAILIRTKVLSKNIEEEEEEAKAVARRRDGNEKWQIANANKNCLNFGLFLQIIK